MENVMVKVNNLNIVYLEGNVFEKKLIETNTGKSVLKFILYNCHISNPDEKLKVNKYDLKIPVNMFGKPAVKMNERIKNGDLVLVEGMLRFDEETNKFKISAVHITHSTAIMRELVINDKAVG
jgi:single-stranded DNA-binding protein